MREHTHAYTCLRSVTGDLRIGIMLRRWTKSKSSPFSHSSSMSSTMNLSMLILLYSKQLQSYLLDIWRYPGWLYRTQVQPQHLSAGILFSHYTHQSQFLYSGHQHTLNGPDTRACPQISDPLWILPYGSVKVSPVGSLEHHGMHHILTVLLRLVIR